MDSWAVIYLGKLLLEDRLREAQQARRFLAAKKNLSPVIKALLLIFM